MNGYPFPLAGVAWLSKERAVRTPWKILLVFALGAFCGGAAFAQTSESFEYGVPPPGWTKTNLQGGSGWYRLPIGVAPLPGWGNGTSSVPAIANSGTHNAYCSWTTGGGAGDGYHNDQWLISPRLTGLTATSTVSYWLRFAFTNYPDTVYFRVSTNGPVPANFTFVACTNIFARAAYTNQFPPWSNHVVNVGALGIPAGTPIWIAIQEYEWDNTWNGAAVQLDVINSDLTAPPEARASPTSLVFTAYYEGADPADQTFALQSVGSSGFGFSSSLAFGAGPAGWVTVGGPASGTLDFQGSQVCTASVSVAGLDLGTYYATNVFTVPGATNSPLRVPITLNVIRRPQTISFPNPGPQYTTNHVGLAGTASSGLPVTFSVFSGPGSVTGATNLSFTGTGTVKAVAWQLGNAYYDVAPCVTQAMAVTKPNAEIAFTDLSHVYDGAPHGATVATVPEGLTVDTTYNGGAALPVAIGSYAVTSVVNDVLYGGTATATYTITRMVQTVDFPNPGAQWTTSVVGLAATASSGLPVTFSVASGPGLLGSDTNLSFTGAGAVSVVATQAGDANWLPAATTNDIAVSKVAATVFLGSLNQTYDGAPKNATATTDPPGLAVDFTYDGSATAPTAAGSYAATGTVNDAIYAGSAADTLTIGRANQTIAFPPVAPQQWTASVGLAATASSGLGLAFGVADGPGTISGGTNLTFTSPGDVAVVAAQAGDGNYEAAPSVTNLVKAFCVSPDNGVLAGGNAVTVSNGHFGTITNVLVGGVSAGFAQTGPNAFTVTLPAAGAEGAVDIVVQTSDNGDTTLTGAYRYNPPGRIGSEGLICGWEELAGLPEPTYYLAAGSLQGSLYAVGGMRIVGGWSFQSVTNVYRWDGTVWTEVEGRPGAARDLSVATFRDGLYALGGSDGAVVRTNVVRFDGTTWTEVEGLPAGRTLGAAAVWEDQLYYLGGGTNVYRYDGTNWTEVASLPEPMEAVTASVWDGKLLAIGGVGDGSGLTSVYAYDGSGWTESVPLPVPLDHVSSGVLDGGLHVWAGAHFGDGQTNVYRFDGVRWQPEGALPNGRWAVGGCVHDGALHAVAGFGPDSTGSGPSTNVYRSIACNTPGVEPAMGSWTGGYEVVISGANLCNGLDLTDVTLAGVAVHTIVSQSSTQIVVLAGAAVSAGAGDVMVQSESYGTTTKSNAFTYFGAGIQVSGPGFAVTPFGAVVTNVYTVTNAGDEALVISVATNDGAGAGYFDVSALAGLTVSPGTASNFPVVFTATEVGTFNPVCTTVNSSPYPHYYFGLYGSVFQLSTNIGPYTGGNVLTVTNGYFGAITNILVGGIGVVPESSGDNWFTITMPPATNEGSVDLIVQTSDHGDILLAEAYTYHPAGQIGWTDHGQSWTNLGAGMNAAVNSLVWQGANLYAGGGFTEASGEAATYVAMWDGAKWTHLGEGMDDSVNALVHDGTNLYAGGAFTSAGLVAAQHVAMWNGSDWTPLGAGLAEAVMALAHDGTNLVAGCTDGTVAMWDGAKWTTYGDIHSTVWALLNRGGEWFAGSSQSDYVHRWDGAAWMDVGAGVDSQVNALADDGTNLYAGGFFESAGAVIANGVAAWDGSVWTNLDSGMVGDNWAVLALLHDGASLYAGGGFTNAGGMAAANIAMWNGANWTHLGDGVDDFVSTLAHDGTNLYAGGWFTNSGPLAVNFVGKWGPTVFSGVEPSIGSWTGGYEVVISGTNLCNGLDLTEVTLAGVAVQTIVSQSATQIVVLAGAAVSAGAGDVRVVSTSYGETVKSNAFEYLREEQAALSFAPASPQAYGTTNGLSATGGSGTGAVSYAVTSGPGLIVDGSNLTVTDGSGSIVVVATKAQDDLYFEASATGTVAAAKATATVTLGDLSQTYDGTPKSATATTEPAGLVVEFTYDGSSTAPTALGIYAVTGAVNDVNYEGSTNGTFLIFNNYTLTIQSKFGTPEPAAGIYTNMDGAVLTNGVTPPAAVGGTQYVCTGWALAGHSPESGSETQMVMTVTNDAVLAWQWGTNFWLTPTAGAHGSVDVGAGWLAAGTITPVTATPDAYCTFSHWTGDATGDANPFELTMDGPKAVAAHFVEILTTNHPTPLWWLAKHGLTNDFEAAVDEDPDGDGAPTWQERIMDTDPTNRLSVLVFTRIEPAYGTNCWEVVWTNTEPPYLVVTYTVCEVVGHIYYWPVSTARVYDVQWTPGLDMAPWTEVDGMTNQQPQGDTLSLTNPVAGGDRTGQFRLRVNMP